MSRCHFCSRGNEAGPRENKDATHSQSKFIFGKLPKTPKREAIRVSIPKQLCFGFIKVCRGVIFVPGATLLGRAKTKMPPTVR